MKNLAGFAGVLLAASSLTVASVANAEDDVRLRLNWMYYGSHAGFALGKDKGLYDEADIDLVDPDMPVDVTVETHKGRTFPAKVEPPPAPSSAQNADLPAQVEPRSGVTPMTLGGCGGNAERLRRLLDGHAGEEPKLHNLAMAFVQFAEL